MIAIIFHPKWLLLLFKNIWIFKFWNESTDRNVKTYSIHTYRKYKDILNKFVAVNYNVSINYFDELDNNFLYLSEFNHEEALTKKEVKKAYKSLIQLKNMMMRCLFSWCIHLHLIQILYVCWNMETLIVMEFFHIEIVKQTRTKGLS